MISTVPFGTDVTSCSTSTSLAFSAIELIPENPGSTPLAVSETMPPDERIGMLISSSSSIENPVLA